MKIKSMFIMTILLIIVAMPIACNSDAIVNANNPGEKLDITKYLVKGKINIVDFYSEFCPPCKKISPLLSKLDKKRDDIVVIKIDINRKGIKGIDWRSPLAKQYELRSIPHFKIYDGEGNKLSEGMVARQKIAVYFNEAEIK
jgi:thiol-disulfide isomerase/thioredoxin